MPPEVGGAVIQVDVQNTVQSRFPKGLSSSAANGTPTLQQTRKTDDSDVLINCLLQRNWKFLKVSVVMKTITDSISPNYGGQSEI